MIALRGQSQVGNMLHVIIGPETELFSDIHGATILDVTSLLMEMDGSRQVFLTLTRCRSEQLTTGNMQGMSIKYVNSFQGTAPGSPDQPENGQPEDGQPQYGQVHYAQQSAEKSLKDTAPHQTSAASETSTPAGKCGYCDQERPLLKVPGFYICQVCAQIELGRAATNTNNAETPDDSQPAK